MVCMSGKDRFHPTQKSLHFSIVTLIGRQQHMLRPENWIEFVYLAIPSTDYYEKALASKIFLIQFSLATSIMR